jgi:hypothetical protein
MLLYGGLDLSLPSGVILHLFCTGLDIADLFIDMTARGKFTHKTMMEQVEYLESFIVKHTSFVIRTKPFQTTVMSSVGESSSVETKHIPSLSLTYEPPPKPRTLKERVINPLEFPINFKKYGRTSSLSWHEENIFLSKEVAP